MTSRFQPARLMTPLLILLAFAAVSYWLNPVPWNHVSGAVQATFAVSLLVVIALAVVARGRMKLRIDEQGLEICYIVGAPRRYAWAEIEGAGLFKIRFLGVPLASAIHLRLTPGERGGDTLQRVAGFRVSIPGFFEESAAEILETILLYKREAESVPPLRYTA